MVTFLVFMLKIVLSMVYFKARGFLTDYAQPKIEDKSTN